MGETRGYSIYQNDNKVIVRETKMSLRYSIVVHYYSLGLIRGKAITDLGTPRAKRMK